MLAIAVYMRRSEDRATDAVTDGQQQQQQQQEQSLYEVLNAAVDTNPIHFSIFGRCFLYLACVECWCVYVMLLLMRLIHVSLDYVQSFAVTTICNY